MLMLKDIYVFKYINMPSLNKAFLENLQDDYKSYPCFIETGTNLGITIFAMEPLFNALHTIEFSPHYYNNTKNSYNGNKINFLLGDSSVVLESLLPSVNTKCIFFLDAHWSGGDTGHSEKDCPLVEEITHIQHLCKHEAIIIIDDVRLFGLDKSSGKLNEDWSNINQEKLLSILRTRIAKVYHRDSDCAKDDRLVIHINAIV